MRWLRSLAVLLGLILVLPLPESVVVPVQAAVCMNDTFTDTANDSLTSQHTGETGATWTIGSGTGNAVISNANRVRKETDGGSTAMIYASGLCATEDMVVTAIFRPFTLINGNHMGVCARAATNAITGYCVVYESTNTEWRLWEIIASTFTSLGVCDVTLTLDQDYTVILTVTDALKRADITGCATMDHTATNDIAGVSGRTSLYVPNTDTSDTTGMHIDSVTSSDFVAASGRELTLLGVSE